MGRLASIADLKIDPCQNRMVSVGKGNVDDIMAEILSHLARTKHQTKAFAQHLRRASDRDTLKAVWKFTKENVRYVRDKGNHEIINSPACTWHRREIGSDCKSFTAFIASILYHLGIPYKIRLIWQDRRKPGLAHVYPVALIEGREVPVDAVHNRFGSEVEYYKKQEFGPYGGDGIGQIRSGGDFVIEVAAAVLAGVLTKKALEWLG